MSATPILVPTSSQRVSIEALSTIEALSSVLSGAAVTWQAGDWLWDIGSKPADHGAAFIAIDVNTIMPAAEFTRRVEALVDEIHRAPRADGVDRLFVPGEMEWEKHARATREGIALPSDVVESPRDSGAMVGLKLEDYL